MFYVLVVKQKYERYHKDSKKVIFCDFFSEIE